MDSALINMLCTCWSANLFEQPGLGREKKKGTCALLFMFFSHIWGPDLLPVSPSVIISMMQVEGSHGHFFLKCLYFSKVRSFIYNSHITFNMSWFNFLSELLTNGSYLMWTLVKILSLHLHQHYKVSSQWESCFRIFCSLLRIHVLSYNISLIVLSLFCTSY